MSVLPVTTRGGNMELEYTATVQDLEWAIENKRAGDDMLAVARLDLTLAKANLDAVVDGLNILYRERLAARSAARLEREAGELDREESESRLLTYADWLEEESRRGDRRYHAAVDAVDEAQKEVDYWRNQAREYGRELYQLLVAYREGLVIETPPYVSDWDDDDDWSYLYDEWEDNYVEDLLEDEGERLTVDAERTRRRTRKLKAYNPRRRRKRAS